MTKVLDRRYGVPAWRSGQITGLAGLVFAGVILGPMALKQADESEKAGDPYLFARAAGIAAITVGMVHIVLFLAYIWE